MREDISAPLQDIIGKFARSGGVPIAADTLLDSDLAIDSPRMVDILLDIEDRFHISIDDTQMRNIKTFGELVAFVDGIVNAST